MNRKTKCVEFLKANGAVIVFEDEEYLHMDFNGFGVDISDDEIVFIDDTGDFAHLQVDYYHLIGWLICHNMIAINFIRVK